jgi:hypothetical protein
VGTSVTDCICAAGSYLLNDAECTSCIPELTCPAGRDRPTLKEGYVAAVPEPGNYIEVYNCQYVNRCPGGPLGTCGQGRFGRACGQCLDYHFTDMNGLCTHCDYDKGAGGARYAILLLIFVCVMGLLLSMTIIFARDPKSETMQQATAGVMIGMTFNLVQILQVFELLTVEWGSPFIDILRITRLFAFELDLLQFECFIGTTPVTRYAAQVFTGPMILVVHGLVCLVYGYRKAGKLRGTVSWTNGWGTMALVLFITFALIAVLPFQCVRHPSGFRSTYKYMDIRCNVDPAHGALLGLGWFALVFYVIVPFSIFCWLVRQYPIWVANGNQVYLQRSRFLFIRYDHRHYYFALPLLFRNTLIAFAPAILQFVGLQVVFIACMLNVYAGFQLYLKPWRTPMLNRMDGFVSFCVLLMLMGGAVLVPWDQTQLSETTQALQSYLVISCLAVFLALVAMFGHSCYVRLNPEKKFAIFLSHHKGDSAAAARWFHLALTKVTGRRVFLDSDNLFDLGTLLPTVQNDIEACVVLLTKDVLFRPWCIGEILNAKFCGIKIVLTVLPGGEKVISELKGGLGDRISKETYQMLEPYHIGREDIEAFYADLGSLPLVDCTSPTQKELPRVVQEVVALCRKGTTKGVANGTLVGQLQEEAVEMLVLGDHISMDAGFAARVLTMKLIERASVTVGNNVDAFTMPKTDNTCMILLTANVMSLGAVAALLVDSVERGARCLSIVVEDFGFEFVTDFSTIDFTPSEWSHATTLRPAITLKEIRAAYELLFENIAVRFSPRGSIEAIDGQCAMVLRVANGLQPKAQQWKDLVAGVVPQAAPAPAAAPAAVVPQAAPAVPPTQIDPAGVTEV